MFRILISDPIEKEGLAPLRESNHFELIQEKTPKDLRHFDGWIVRSQTKVTAALIAKASKLKVIGRAGTGVDNIDVPEATRRGILVVNAPGANAVAVAEHVFALMLALSRKLIAADARVKSGGWRDGSLMGRELYGKILGLIGLGRVGREVARRALAFQMQVLAYDPFISKEQARELGVGLMEIDEVLAAADIVSIHVPLTDSTRHLMNSSRLAQLKPSAFLINTSRGEVLQEVALVQALSQSKLAGAALDVFEKEPPLNSPLFSVKDRLVLTPHQGASTMETQIRVAQELAANIAAFFERGIVRGGVNLPAEFEPAILERRSAHIALSERLGRFLGQAASGSWRRLQLSCLPAFTEKERRVFVNAALRGLLAQALGDKVNMVNADFYAKERHLNYEADFLETAAPRPLVEEIVLTVTFDGTKTASVSGCVETSGEIKISRIGGLFVDVKPYGNLLVLENQDRPGIIGRVGTMLGEQKINIADMRVGRREKGAQAVMVITVDDKISPAVLSKIAKIPGLTRVVLVSL